MSMPPESWMVAHREHEKMTSSVEEGSEIQSVFFSISGEKVISIQTSSTSEKDRLDAQ